MARPTRFPPMPEPGFATECDRGYEATLRAVVAVIGRRLDAGVAARDLPALTRVLLQAAADLQPLIPRVLPDAATERQQPSNGKA